MGVCENPYMLGIVPAGCGKCIPCRISRRKVWAHRILLESYEHDDNAFVTLTYADKEREEKTCECKEHSSSLNTMHFSKFIRKLRKRISPAKVRYFVAGEYGDKGRPHYHVALFGYKTCERGRTEHRIKECCIQCSGIQKDWGHGSVDLGELNEKTAHYVSGYVVKKMDKEEQKQWGLMKEFCRMSLKPGIGHGVTTRISSLLKPRFKNYVPTVLHHGSSSRPLGKYLRRKIREQIGLEEDKKFSEFQKYGKDLRPMYEIAINDAKNSAQPWSTKSISVSLNSQQIQNIKGRQKIYG